jgi:peptidoglycan/LPS O-acetylase OafA/YrhL
MPACIRRHRLHSLLPERLKALVAFIARNSLWIYLWHIPLTKVLEFHSGPSFVLRFFFVFSVSMALVYIQVTLVEKLILPRLQGEALRKNVRILFTG